MLVVPLEESAVSLREGGAVSLREGGRCLFKRGVCVKGRRSKQAEDNATYSCFNRELVK